MATRPPRVPVFPIFFGLSLFSLSVAYYNRKKFFSDVWGRKREQYLESHWQAEQFKAVVAEGVERERKSGKNLLVADQKREN